MTHEIVYINKDQEVVKVVAETDQEKEDLVSILEKNEALFTVDLDGSEKWIGIPA